MSRPLLSICIPTFNRAHLLIDILTELDTPGYLPFEFEVVVVDNGCPEADYAPIKHFNAQNFQYRYFRNAETIPAYHNFFGALRRARGEFCVYLADDDRLVAATLIEAVETMAADPLIAATICCWGEFNGITGEIVETGHALPDAIYDLESASSLVAILMHVPLLPEIGLYRTDIIQKCLLPTDIFYWPFLVTDRLLKLGRIRTLERTFYLCSNRLPGEAFPRDTLGRKLPFETWDKITRGQELLLNRHYYGPEEIAANTSIEKTLKDLYLGLACSSAWNQNNYLNAWEVAFFLNARQVPSTYLGGDALSILPYFASMSALVTSFAWMPEIRHFVLYDETLKGLAVALPAGIDISHADQPGKDGVPADTIVLVRLDAERDQLIAAGGTPGQIFSHQSLLQLFAF